MKKILFVLSVAALGVCTGTKTFAANMAIDSLTGLVTQNEINAFKTYMATQTPGQTPWGTLGGTGHNEWADGNSGNALEAMGLMYEVSGDTQILTNLIAWTDKCVSERNDLMSSANGGQRVMWTGKINKVWCPNDPTSSSATYAGGENGDTKAHIAYTALLILQQPWLWSQTIPDGNPYGYGVTYFQRATNYVAKCDQGNDDYDHIFYTSTNTVRNPSNWPSGFHTMEAINIQMMLLGYLERISQCHTILADAASRVSQYDTVIKTAGRECLNGMKHSSTVNGQTVYKWGYYPWATTYNESVGHGAYDIVGIWRIYNSSTYGFSLSEVTPIANAVVDVMNVSTNDFSGNVDGSGGTQNYMQAQWLLIADWNPAVYNVIAQADYVSGRYKTTTLMDATMLWQKQRRYLDSSTWEIQNVTSGMALNNQGSTTNGSPISQWSWVSSPNLEFTLIPTSSGYYQINSVKSGKDIAVQSASTANGALLVQWSFGSSGDDQWMPVQNSDGTWAFFNLHSGKVLNNTGGSLTQGTQYSQWSWLNSSNEKFNLIQR